METTTSLLCSSSKVKPFNFTRNFLFPSSLRQSNKHLECKFSSSFSPAQSTLKNRSNIPLGYPLFYSTRKCSFSFGSNSNTVITRLSPVQCASSSFSNHSLREAFKNLSLEGLKSALLSLTPYDVCKWALLLSIVVAASKWTLNALFSPFLWMYFSWTWLFWPWTGAIFVATYGLYCLSKHLQGTANAFQQLAIVTAAFTWLTLVPPAHFNGFLEGWPVVFFFVYHYFFFFNVNVRKRLYGDYYPREHDPVWDISLPNWQKLLFCVGVMIGHWLAAFEGPELHLIPGGFVVNLGIWALIMMTLFMQYHSTLYLAKYSEKVVVPTGVVQFGPYRFVRHPIYASTMLLFVTYFAALRAPLSALFVVAVCILYYGRKANLEEVMMVKRFGQMYNEYSSKVRYKLIPFVY
ncbi:OLC1v1007664C1 [Oldenlandia corymbosa var. corymbosa]|uniref:OLC1v1007664C1 n=1 Tax=Oldenlandia corymbosa var. corymbosa TaxID=529605 RepID=A0AAV1DL91_OLDCO|nr:OLC1v1007664C1 [Oldenlandia corymbosa var. corymbosa]